MKKVLKFFNVFTYLLLVLLLVEIAMPLLNMVKWHSVCQMIGAFLLIFWLFFSGIVTWGVMYASPLWVIGFIIVGYFSAKKKYGKKEKGFDASLIIKMLPTLAVNVALLGAIVFLNYKNITDWARVF